jgi:hypothetical protein
MMHVQICQNPSSWGTYVESHPSAYNCHRWCWRQTIEEAFGHGANYLSLSKDYAMQDVLPLFSLRSGVEVICTGEGALRQEVERTLPSLGLRETVQFVGYPPDMREWFAIDDLTVLPSLYERLPVTPIDSLASGKPMVATAVDGTPAVTIHERAELTVPSSDFGSVAEAIWCLLGDPELAHGPAAEGRQWALGKCSVERLIERTEQFHVESSEGRVGQLKTAHVRPHRNGARTIQANSGRGQI